MSRSDIIKQTSLPRRILGSAWFKMGVFILLFLVLLILVTGRADSKVQDRQLEFLQDAVRRAAVQSYALEGRYPDNLAHLEENYGLVIDRNNYAVYYEPMGDNLLPQIKVIPLS